MHSNPATKNAKRWLARHFAYSPQREAAQYFRQYPSGQPLVAFGALVLRAAQRGTFERHPTV